MQWRGNAVFDVERSPSRKFVVSLCFKTLSFYYEGDRYWRRKELSNFSTKTCMFKHFDVEHRNE